MEAKPQQAEAEKRRKDSKHLSYLQIPKQGEWQRALCFNNVRVLLHETDKLEGNHMQYQLVFRGFL